MCLRDDKQHCAHLSYSMNINTYRLLCRLVDSTAHQLGHKRYRLQLLLLIQLDIISRFQVTPQCC